MENGGEEKIPFLFSFGWRGIHKVSKLIIYILFLINTTLSAFEFDDQSIVSWNLRNRWCNVCYLGWISLAHIFIKMVIVVRTNFLIMGTKDHLFGGILCLIFYKMIIYMASLSCFVIVLIIRISFLFVLFYFILLFWVKSTHPHWYYTL
jgi:hypothetical protein